MNPQIKVRIVHSKTEPAWRIISMSISDKQEVAIIPYNVIEGSEMYNTEKKNEALQHARFVTRCFNNVDKIDV